MIVLTMTELQADRCILFPRGKPFHLLGLAAALMRRSSGGPGTRAVPGWFVLQGMIGVIEDNCR